MRESASRELALLSGTLVSCVYSWSTELGAELNKLLDPPLPGFGNRLRLGSSVVRLAWKSSKLTEGKKSSVPELSALSWPAPSLVVPD